MLSVSKGETVVTFQVESGVLFLKSRELPQHCSVSQSSVLHSLFKLRPCNSSSLPNKVPLS